MALNSNIKKINTLKIVEALKYSEPMTKSDIVRITDLTNVTVNNFINDFKSTGLVKEVGIDSLTGGRNALLYQFNSKCYYTVGLVIGISEVTIGLFDFYLNPLYEKSTPLDLSSITVEQGIDNVYDFVRSSLSEMPVDIEKIVGLGVSVPGPVNYQKGVVRHLVNIPTWKNVPLKAIMEKRLEIPVFVDKDNYCNVACLRWLNPNENNDNFVYLGLVGGVGSGVVINGKVLRGQHYIFGELGHMSVDASGEACKCGGNGCVELYISDKGILKEAQERLDISKDSDILTAETITMDTIVQAALDNDAMAKDILSSKIDIFAKLFDCAIKSYDPDKIVLHSSWIHKHQNFFNEIVDKVYRQSVLIGRDELIIELNEVQNLFLKGAATLVLDEQFSLNNPNSVLLRRTMVNNTDARQKAIS